LIVPGDISIIGFDDIDIASQMFTGLTTVAAPIDKIARHSFSMLYQLISSADVDNKHIALSARLIVRQSCSKLTKQPVAA
jgi:DNA-binding LacI/PurR family transcriptional regulator